GISHSSVCIRSIKLKPRQDRLFKGINTATDRLKVYVFRDCSHKFVFPSISCVCSHESCVFRGPSSAILTTLRKEDS
ncbi:hypothetical protein KI387_031806, partial [Taxus chinensis]